MEDVGFFPDPGTRLPAVCGMLRFRASTSDAPLARMVGTAGMEEDSCDGYAVQTDQEPSKCGAIGAARRLEHRPGGIIGI